MLIVLLETDTCNSKLKRKRKTYVIINLRTAFIDMVISRDDFLLICLLLVFFLQGTSHGDFVMIDVLFVSK